MTKSLIFTLLAAASFAVPAQTTTTPAPASAEHAAHHNAAAMADAEVRKIDKAQSKLTLKHGEIKKLDMPPMTMVFRVKDAKLLEGLAVGDKIKFDAEQIEGNYTVTAVRKP
jgi:Cu(I)/Ag(I) efflux system periplasmic protein CusF